MRISDWSSDVCSSDVHFRAAAIHVKHMLAVVGDREQDAIAASGTDFFASGERAIDLERKRRSAAVRPAEGHEYGALAAVVDHLRRIDVAIAIEVDVGRDAETRLREKCILRRRLAHRFRRDRAPCVLRSEEHTSELQSLMRISYAVFCLKKKTKKATRESE